MNDKALLKIINEMLEKKESKRLESLNSDLSLRNDLRFDSFDLAELTVRIEDEFGIDIFEESIVVTIGEIIDQINRGN